MPEKVFAEILSKCNDATAAIGDELITQTLVRAEALLNSATMPAVMVVSMDPIPAGLFNFAEVYSSMPLPHPLRHLLVCKEFCLTLTHADTAACYIQQGDQAIPVSEDMLADVLHDSQVNWLVYECPCPALVNGRVILCNISLDRSALWKQLINSSDAVCLRTNATMALPMIEREWLSETLIRQHGNNRVLLWIDRLALLNDEDSAEVYQLVQALLPKLSLSAESLATDTATAASRAKEMLSADDLLHQRGVKILRDAISELQSRATALLEQSVEDLQSTSDSIRQIETQQRNLEIAGELAVGGALRNAYTTLTTQLIDSVEEYNRQVTETVVTEIRKSDVPQKLVEGISDYLDHAWGAFYQNVEQRFPAESEKIFSELMRCMEIDCGKLCANLSADTNSLLRRAIGVDSLTVVNAGAAQGTNAIDALSLETRNMMLLSLPMSLVSPFSGVSALSASRILKSIKLPRVQEQCRQELITSVNQLGNTMVTTIHKQIQAHMDASFEETAAQLRGAYGGLIDRLIAQVETMQDALKETNNGKARVQFLQDQLLPACTEALNETK